MKKTETETMGASSASECNDGLGFTPLPAVKGSVACLTCGCGAHDTMGMERLLAVGFGDVSVTCDGRRVYSENEVKNEEFWIGQNAEAAANSDPNHDWRVHFIAPLYEAVYQRQGKNIGYS